MLAKSYDPINHKIGFDVTDLEGYGSAFNIAIGPVDGTYGGNLDAYEWNPFNFGATYLAPGAGASFGVPFGLTFETTYTWTFETNGKSKKYLQMKKKHLITLFLLILIPVIFFKLRDFGVFDLTMMKNQKRCQHKERAIKVTLSGEVINKYEDRKNHNIRTLEIQDRTGKKYISTMLAADVSGLYDKLNIGDHISKETRQLMVVYGSGIRKDSIVLKFDCEE